MPYAPGDPVIALRPPTFVVSGVPTYPGRTYVSATGGGGGSAPAPAAPPLRSTGVQIPR